MGKTAYMCLQIIYSATLAWLFRDLYITALISVNFFTKISYRHLRRTIFGFGIRKLIKLLNVRRRFSLTTATWREISDIFIIRLAELNLLLLVGHVATYVAHALICARLSLHFILSFIKGLLTGSGTDIDFWRHMMHMNWSVAACDGKFMLPFIKGLLARSWIYWLLDL